jgi:hypothetical protein
MRDVCDRTAEPWNDPVANGGSGTPLAVLAFAGTVARASLAGMTDPTASPDPAASAQVRELAEIPAGEVITRSAVMPISAAAEKLGLSHPEPERSAW